MKRASQEEQARTASQCEVCSECASKYRCPTCEIRYCSVACFKTHRATACVKKQRVGQVVLAKQRPPLPIVDERGEVDPSHAVPDHRLRRIGESSELRNMMRDERLQKLVKQVDASDDPERELRALLQADGDFESFVHKVLVQTGYRDTEGEG